MRRIIHPKKIAGRENILCERHLPAARYAAPPNFEVGQVDGIASAAGAGARALIAGVI